MFVYFFFVLSFIPFFQAYPFPSAKENCPGQSGRANLDGSLSRINGLVALSVEFRETGRVDEVGRRTSGLGAKPQLRGREERRYIVG